MSEGEVLLRGAMIAERVLAYPRIWEADLVLSYIEIPGSNEVPTTPILKELLQAGRAVAVPRVAGDALEWHHIRRLDSLRPGALNVPEPTGDPESVIRLESADSLCLVPGIVWSSGGYRIGFGKGFYDRFLSEYIGESIGLGWLDSGVDDFPTESHDIPVQRLMVA